MAYQDVLDEFDWSGGGGVENGIVTHSNLMATWMDGPQMPIISWCPLGLRRFAWVSYILSYFLAIDFSICAKRRRNNQMKFKSSRKRAIIVEEPIEYTSN